MKQDSTNILNTQKGIGSKKKYWTIFHVKLSIDKLKSIMINNSIIVSYMCVGKVSFTVVTMLIEVK